MIFMAGKPVRGRFFLLLFDESIIAAGQFQRSVFCLNSIVTPDMYVGDEL
jgi:hypothetical protein